MDIALSYLKELVKTGYFEKEHKICDGLHIEGHPSCENVDRWNSTKTFLVENDYLKIKKLPLLVEPDDLDFHPQDFFDAWCFELTAKGEKYLEL